MRVEPVLVLGILASLFAGSVMLVAAETPARAPDATSLAVPVGNHGDYVRYGRFERSDEGASWTRVGLEQFEVRGVQETLDSTGDLRKGVLVQWDPDNVTSLSAFVNMETRDIVKRQFSRAGVWGTMTNLETLETTEEYAEHEESDFGPMLTPYWGALYSEATDTTPFWFQGMKLRTGEDLAPATRREFENLWGLDGEHGRLTEYTAHVVGMASLEGEPALELELRGKVEFRVDTRWLTENPSVRFTVPFLTTNVPSTSDVTFSRHLWMTADYAYPTMMEDALTIAKGAGDLSTTKQVLLDLSHVERGDEPIPWITGAAAARPMTPLSPERSLEGQTFPSEGSVSLGCLRLANALERVEEAPEHADFRQWRTMRTPNYLLGVTADCDGESARWHLAYATPDGEAFGIVLRTGGAATDMQARFSDRTTSGALQSFTFDPALVPSGLITFGHVERFWNRIAAAATFGSEPLHLTWGITFPGNCLEVCGAHLIVYPGAYGSPAAWRTIEASAYHPDAHGNGTTFVNETGLSVDADTGELRAMSLTGFYSRPMGPLVVAGGASEDFLAERPKSVASGNDLASAPQPRQVGPAVLVSGTLIALWLAVYFFPLAKYAATQAFLIVPGYAKLRKDRLLDHELRDQLVNVIREDPGLSATEISKRVDAGWSTIVYHLGVIEKNGIVTSMVDTRHRRFFPVGQINHHERGRIAVLKNVRTRDVLDRVVARPGLHQGQLAKEVGVSLPGVKWHLKRLEHEGFVTREKKGRSVLVFPRAAKNVAVATPPTAVEG